MGAERVNHPVNVVRFVAAVVVVVSHVRALWFADASAEPTRSAAEWFFFSITALGHPAVIVFFVLSGYWVGGSAVRRVQRARPRWGDYATARLTRLLIVLLPALLLTQVVDRLGSAVFPQSDIYTGTIAYHTVVPAVPVLERLDAVTTLGNAAFLQSILVPTLGTDSPLWSLAYEFWYYAIFPLALIVLVPRASAPGTTTRMRLVAAAALTVCVLIAGAPVLLLLPAWLAGAAIGWRSEEVVAVLRRWGPDRVVVLRAAATLVLLLAAIASTRLPGWTLVVVVGLPAALLMCTLADGARDRAPSVTVRALSRGADWSYSLYAVHVPLVAFLAAALIGRAGERWNPGLPSVALAVGLGLVVAAIAWGFGRITEQRTEWVRTRLPWVRRAALSAARGR